MSPISHKADAHLRMMSGFFSISVQGFNDWRNGSHASKLHSRHYITRLSSYATSPARPVLFSLSFLPFSLSFNQDLSLHVFHPLPLLYRHVHHPSQTQKHKTQTFMRFLHLCPFEIHVRSCIRSTHEAGRTSDQRI